MAEYWDAYDARRNLLGHTLRRGDPIPEGEYHLIVQVCVLDRDGRLLLTRRHPDKPLGGLWEVTAGSALAGESSRRGAVRELWEETGLRAEEETLCLLYTRTGKDYFLDSYFVRLEGAGEDYPLRMQEGETTEGMWADQDDLRRMRSGEKLVPITLEACGYLGLMERHDIPSGTAGK